MTQPRQASLVRVNRARHLFFDEGNVPGGLVSDTIVRSWERSVASGIPVEQDRRDLPILSPERLTTVRQAGEDLIRLSRPVMENLFGQIRQSSSMIILTDATGAILHSLGDSGFVSKATKISLEPGGVWSEQARGTNAIGTCLVEEAPVRVHRSEHFTAVNHFLTCSASPIFDPFGRIEGVLDVSGDGRASQQHTLALVRISTQQIENMMFAQAFEEDLVLHFHRHPQFIGTFYEGIAAFSEEGRLTAANRSALLHLGIDRYQQEILPFDDLFDLTMEDLLKTPPSGIQPLRQLRHRSGKIFFARIRCSRRMASRKTPGPSSESRAAAPWEPDSWRPEDLTLGDPAMQKAIERARLVFKHDIPILIEGESGTGKELFARALHQSSSRRNAPFVALNCAGIPEGLIEAELFGYQEGAYTGARRKGFRGKIRQADGGTLFLDEIGDMPLELQARLLRVLQQRTVAPLGGTEEFSVDMAVICATHRNIRDEVDAGRFREDLYYRLNGLLLSLPPLRSRSDLLPLAEAILKRFLPRGRRLRLGRATVELFSRHPWPGNVRQLSTLLRTAVALLDDREEELGPEHLPENFLDEARRGCPERSLADHRSLAMHVHEDSKLDRLEQIAIGRALEKSGGNLSEAARRLGISRTTLYRKLRKRSRTDRSGGDSK
jgi:transcriptional regulator of acetoin/glycerol metabolism